MSLRALKTKLFVSVGLNCHSLFNILFALGVWSSNSNNIRFIIQQEIKQFYKKVEDLKL